MSDSAFRPGSDEEWTALMHRLRLQSKAQHLPFFYARLQARLLVPAAPTTAWRWLRRPAFAVVLSAMIVAISGDNSVAATASVSFHDSQPVSQRPR